VTNQAERETERIVREVERRQIRRQEREWEAAALADYIETVNSVRFVEGYIEGVRVG